MSFLSDQCIAFFIYVVLCTNNQPLYIRSSIYALANLVMHSDNFSHFLTSLEVNNRASFIMPPDVPSSLVTFTSTANWSQ